MQLYMSWYIRSFFGFTFLNIIYFFKYPCTNIFHRRNFYTFYDQHFDGLVQDYNICIANALQILQSCTKPSVWRTDIWGSLIFVDTYIIVYDVAAILVSGGMGLTHWPPGDAAVNL